MEEFSILKPHDLRKKDDDEKAAAAQAIEQAIMDFAYEILAKAKFNEFLEENKSVLLTEGKQIKKVLRLDREEFENRKIKVTDVCDRITSILHEIEYDSKTVITDFEIELTIWISSLYFREEEDFEDK